MMLTGGGEMLSLETSGGGERPARSTLSLVLDGSDVSVVSPVDTTAGDVDGLLDVGGHIMALHRSQVSELDGSEFHAGHVSELIHGGLVGFQAQVESNVVFLDL